MSEALLNLLGQIPNARHEGIRVSTHPSKPGEPAETLADRTVQSLGLKHGDLLFVTYAESESESAKADGNQSTTGVKHATTATQIHNTVKQDPVDDELDKLDGKIKRPRDPKMCRHAEGGMCEYCMPLEPYDTAYQQENNIKHLSFHAYLKKLTASTNKESGSSYMAPLTEPDFRVKVPCPTGHQPWPKGICSKCQPSAITLQQQTFRMVDHVEFASFGIVNAFIDSWRQTGAQRIGWLYGRYVPYDQVPLGIKAVVEAVYEPPQADSHDGVALTLPWAEEEQVDRAAALCGLQKVGVIFTDLVDAGKGDGSVVCKRHVDSYFLSSLELAFAAQLQNQHPAPSRWSDSGKYSSKFVTCVLSGNTKGEIDISCYQASAAAEAMCRADLIEPSVNPSVMRVKEPSETRYVPDVFYRRLNEYKLAVQENAKPAFPVEYLLVTLTHGFPDESKPLFTADAGVFPIENRMHIGVSQDMSAVSRQLGLNADNTSLDAISDFHLLVHIFSLGILSPEEERLVVKVAVDHDVQDGYRLLESPGWQTLVTIVREST